MTEIPVENPYLQYLGVKLVHWTPGRAEFRLTIAPSHLNRQGTLHGGVIATLLDVACGYAGLTPSGAVPGEASATVTLNVSFLDKASSGLLIARGQVLRAGKRLCFASGEVQTEDGRVIATGQGTFRIFRNLPSPAAPAGLAEGA